jgi:hypothetical protein
MTDDRNGNLCIDWVWDGTSEDGWEAVGALNYWQTYAIVEALKPYSTRCKAKLDYYMAKGQQNRGTDTLLDAHACASHALELFTSALENMKDRYKQEG